MCPASSGQIEEMQCLPMQAILTLSPTMGISGPILTPGGCRWDEVGELPKLLPALGGEGEAQLEDEPPSLQALAGVPRRYQHVSKGPSGGSLYCSAFSV